MISDEVGKQLHDKATRGRPVSEEEQALLEQWYASQDTNENHVLTDNLDERKFVNLQKQIETVIAQIMTVIERIQNVTAENETLKQQIAALNRRLVHTPSEKIV